MHPTLSFVALALFAQSTLAAIDLDLVRIGDVGNIGYDGGMYGIHAGRGSVGYDYHIGRTEISSSQWVEFYNTFSTQSDELADTLRPNLWGATLDTSYDGPGDRYMLNSGIPTAADAVAGVSWRQAAMFCNWMHNGQSSDPSAILNGAYDASTFMTNDDNVALDQAARHPDARYWIPNLDEYMKAAFYDPDKNGQGPGWWSYGHSSDEVPVHGLPGEGDVARSLTDQQLIDLTGQASEFFIPLGLYPDVQSPWGLLDVLGGLWEFTEELNPADPNRGRLHKPGSNFSFADDGFIDIAWNFSNIRPNSIGGLRIASSVPGPGSAVVTALGVILASRRRR